MDSLTNQLKSLKPVNRYITIVPHFKETKESGVILPDDYKTEESGFLKATVIDVASDCKEDLKKIKYDNNVTDIVVQKSMIEEVEVGDRRHFFVLENYVMGIYRRPNEG